MTYDFKNEALELKQAREFAVGNTDDYEVLLIEAIQACKKHGNPTNLKEEIIALNGIRSNWAQSLITAIRHYTPIYINVEQGKVSLKEGNWKDDSKWTTIRKGTRILSFTGPKKEAAPKVIKTTVTESIQKQSEKLIDNAAKHADPEAALAQAAQLEFIAKLSTIALEKLEGGMSEEDILSAMSALV